MRLASRPIVRMHDLFHSINLMHRQFKSDSRLGSARQSERQDLRMRERN